MIRNFTFLLIIFFLPTISFAHQPVIVGESPISITAPEISRAFYDQLKSKPRFYQIEAAKTFDLYLNLLVPKNTNAAGRYSAKVYQIINGQKQLLQLVDGNATIWQEFYEPFGGDTYLKGPEWKKAVPAGKYEIEVFNQANKGQYVLAVGEKEFFGPKEILNVYLKVPKIKTTFFGDHLLSFFLTPFGLIALILSGLIFYFFIKLILRF